MDVRVQVSFRANITVPKMAIALYVPPEYGPINLPTNESRNNNFNQNIPRHHRTSHVVPIVDLNNNTVPDILQNLNNNPSAENMQNQNVGFFNQLGSEIMSVFRQLFDIPRRTNRTPQPISSRRNRTDNQRRTRNDHETQQHPLPDLLLQLQYGVSLDLSIESSSTSSARNPNRLNHIAQDNSDVESSSSFELKVSLNYWEGVGRELRRIGDQFQYDNSFREEEFRSHSTEIRLLLKIAVPTFAIIGFGGIYCFRKLL